MIKAALDPAFLVANCSSPARIDVGREHSDLQSGSGNMHCWVERENLSLYHFIFSCYSCSIMLKAYSYWDTLNYFVHICTDVL